MSSLALYIFYRWVFFFRILLPLFFALSSCLRTPFSLHAAPRVRSRYGRQKRRAHKQRSRHISRTPHQPLIVCGGLLRAISLPPTFCKKKHRPSPYGMFSPEKKRDHTGVRINAGQRLAGAATAKGRADRCEPATSRRQKGAQALTARTRFEHKVNANAIHPNADAISSFSTIRAQCFDVSLADALLCVGGLWPAQSGWLKDGGKCPAVAHSRFG